MVGDGADAHLQCRGDLAHRATVDDEREQLAVAVGQRVRRGDQLGQFDTRQRVVHGLHRPIESIAGHGLHDEHAAVRPDERVVLGVAQQPRSDVERPALDRIGADDRPRCGEQLVERLGTPLGPLRPPSGGRGETRQQSLQHHPSRQVVGMPHGHQAAEHFVLGRHLVGARARRLVPVAQTCGGDQFVERLEPHPEPPASSPAHNDRSMVEGLPFTGQADEEGGVRGHDPSVRAATLHTPHTEPHRGPHRGVHLRFSCRMCCDDVPSEGVNCTWRTGPDAGTSIELGVGRHLVGRAPAAPVRCDDPTLEPHHVLLEVLDDGTVHATQLTGRVPVRCSGVPLSGRTLVPADAVLELGSSTLQLGAVATAVSPAMVRPDGTVVRGPRAVPDWTPIELTEPTSPADDTHDIGGLLPAALGLVGAAVLATVLHQPMFLLFGALGSVVAFGSWLAQHLGARRARTRRRAEHAAALAAYELALDADRNAFDRAHRHSVPTVVTARDAVATRSLWARRAAHPDAFRVSIGLGDVAWRTLGQHVAHLPSLPVAADLGPGARLAFTGPGADGVARAVVVQLATSCGPADLRLVIVTRDAARWNGLRGLPQLVLPDGEAAIVGEAGLADALEQLDGGIHVVIVTDMADALATRTGPLRRALGDAALLAVVDDGDGVPPLCTAVLTLRHGPMARWVPDTTVSLLPTPVRVAGFGVAATVAHTTALCGLRDPEDAAAAGRLPRTVDLVSLLGTGPLDANTIAAGWSDVDTPFAPCTPLGVAADGIVDVDLVRDGPHALLAGTTGAGKSELLRSLVLGLAVRVAPSQLQLVLVDYKGGATFDDLTALPHVVGVVTDLDDALADRALRSLHAELRRREAVLREHAAADLPSLRIRAPHVEMPRLVIVVDEFAALVAEQSEFLHALVGVAQRGRSLGVHLLLATQRPQGVISDDIRANTNLRIALRLHDAADAIDVVGDRSPAQLPRRIPGRAVMRLGADEHVVFQTAHVADAAVVVDAVCAAAALPSTVASTWPAPWAAPLPDRLHRHELPSDAIGWCDDPDRQCRTPLQWSPDDGSVVVAGSPGSGATSTLRLLAIRALARRDVHVHVLAASADVAWDALAAHPRGVVVALHETERVARLLHRLRLPSADGVHRVVVIDGLDAVRRTLDTTDTIETFDALDHVLGTVHDTVLVSTTRPGTVPAALLARCAHRWVMHLHDAHDAAILGVSASQVPRAIAGRVQLAEVGLTAQLVEPSALLHSVERPADAIDAGQRVDPLDVVPSVVAAATLPVGERRDGDQVLPIGVDVTTGQVRCITVPDGDHVLVLGGGRCGRSTTLNRLATAWRQAHPDGTVVAVLPRRSAFDRGGAHLVVRVATELHELDDATGAVLVVCDDAELIDDPDGLLASLAAGRADGLTIVAAARADALRQRYGHWTNHVRHGRLGVVAAGGGDADGELLSAVLPRRLPARARPGLMWIVDHDGHHLVQVAQDPDVTEAQPLEPGGSATPRDVRLATR